VDKITKPTPIFVARVTNIQPLSQLLEEIAIVDYDIKIINNEQIKIQKFRYLYQRE